MGRLLRKAIIGRWKRGCNGEFIHQFMLSRNYGKSSIKNPGLSGLSPNQRYQDEVIDVPQEKENLSGLQTRKVSLSIHAECISVSKANDHDPDLSKNRLENPLEEQRV